MYSSLFISLIKTLKTLQKYDFLGTLAKKWLSFLNF